MTTVKELIKELKQIEDKSQTVIWQYYLAEHFCFDLDGPQTMATKKEFDRVAEKTDSFTIWEDTAQEINDLVFTEIAKRNN
jgi:hypothetical protein